MHGPSDKDLWSIENEGAEEFLSDRFYYEEYSQADEHDPLYIPDSFLGIETTAERKEWGERRRLTREERQKRSRKKFPYLTIVTWDYSKHRYHAHCSVCGSFFTTTPRKMTKGMIRCECSEKPNVIPIESVTISPEVFDDIAEASDLHSRSKEARRIERSAFSSPKSDCQVEVGDFAVWFDQQPNGSYIERRNSQRRH